MHGDSLDIEGLSEACHMLALRCDFTCLLNVLPHARQTPILESQLCALRNVECGETFTSPSHANLEPSAKITLFRQFIPGYRWIR